MKRPQTGACCCGAEIVTFFFPVMGMTRESVGELLCTVYDECE